MAGVGVYRRNFRFPHPDPLPAGEGAELWRGTGFRIESGMTGGAGALAGCRFAIEPHPTRFPHPLNPLAVR